VSDWPGEGHLDTPMTGEVLQGRFAWIRGWAAPVGETLDRVVIGVNGRRAGLARLGCPRPDLAGLSDHPSAPMCGFEFLLDLTLLDPGPVTVAARAEGPEGSRRLPGAAEVSFESAAEPMADLPVRPAPRSDPRRPPRVVVAAHDLGVGGAQTLLSDLVKRLPGHGIECRVVAFSDGVHRERLEAEGIQVSLVPRPPIGGVDAYEEGLAADALDGADVVLANTLATFPIADMATRRGVPVVWAIHEAMGVRAFWEVGFGNALDPGVRALAEDALRHATLVTVQSDELSVHLVPGVDRRSIAVVPYEPDVDAHPVTGLDGQRRIRDERSLPSTSVVLLCLGTLEARKGQAVLIGAFARLADRFPDAVLVIVGGRPDRAFAAGIAEMTARLGLEDRIRVEPEMDDPHDWFTASDALVCSSDHEVRPISIIEAMARERSVITTRILGVDDLVLPGVSGELCRPCDARDLATAIERAIGRRERLARMGESARERLRATCRVERFVGAYAGALTRAGAG
jgi:glycosyltransferase involved in cell wall biosynthesis